MTNRSNLRRLQALESIPPPPSACRAALRAYYETGALPTDPPLRRIVERVTAAEREAAALVEIVEPPSQDQSRSRETRKD